MRERIIAAMPLISLMMFLFSGFVLESWLMGVSFFLLMPLSWILLSSRWMHRLTQMMPLISLMVFLWLAFGADLAHIAWVVFFAIPISDLLVHRNLRPKRMVTLGITFGYIVLGVVLDGFWHPGWLMFLLIPIINILFFPEASFKQFSSDSRYYKSKVFEYVRTYGPFKEETVIVEDDEE